MRWIRLRKLLFKLNQSSNPALFSVKIEKMHIYFCLIAGGAGLQALFLEKKLKAKRRQIFSRNYSKICKSLDLKSQDSSIPVLSKTGLPDSGKKHYFLTLSNN
jgi:hypothetical protein